MCKSWRKSTSYSVSVVMQDNIVNILNKNTEYYIYIIEYE